MNEVSIDFSQGDEDKLAILNLRVGDLEFLGVNFDVIEEEDIQINRPGSPLEGFYTPQLRFDAL
jgi:hypothetical protein